MSAQDSSIVIAIADPTLRTEAIHIAAATGHRAVTATDERDIYRLGARAEAIILDADYADLLTESAARRDQQSSPIYLVCLDPGPVDKQLVRDCGAEVGYVIPSQNKEFLITLGEQSRPAESQTPVPRSRAATELPNSARLQRPLSNRISEQHYPAQFAPPQSASRRHPHLTIAVVSAGGGAGASTVAAAISRVAAHENGGAVTLIDAIDHSGGLDLLLGIEKHDGLRWPDLNLGDGRVNASDLRACLPTTGDGIAVLTERRTSDGTASFGDREEIETVLSTLHSEPGLSVIDANPWHIPRSIDAAVLICPAELRCAARAAHLSTQLSGTHTPHCLVVRHRQWSALSIEEMENLVRSQVIAEIGTIKRLTKSTESGGLPDRIPKPLSIVAHAVLAEYGWNTAETH